MPLLLKVLLPTFMVMGPVEASLVPALTFVAAETVVVLSELPLRLIVPAPAKFKVLATPRLVG